MNIASKKLSALIFSAVIMNSVQGMEQDNMTEITTTQVVPSAWYKNSSVQVAAVVTTATAALVSYAVAVRMGKIPAPALPVFVAGLFAAKLIQESTVHTSTLESDANATHDNSQHTQQTSDEQNQEQDVQEAPEVPVQTDVWSDMKKVRIDLMNRLNFPRIFGELTAEDFKEMNEDSIR
jgi:type III secretory pathway component EscV